MEIEFKLSCITATASALCVQLKQLTGRAPRRLKLQNTYYDTPQQALRALGIALRIRRQGKRLLQTVKCAGQVHGGLSRRPEWESPFHQHFDFAGIDDAKVRNCLEALAHSPGYQATLTTDFERNIWYWQPQPDTCVEIALDRGTISAGGKQEAICELELELVKGHPESLFDLVAQLGNLVPLFPAALSKAARGSLLLSGKPPQLSLPSAETGGSGDNTNTAAFQVLAQHCLDHISLHLPVHQPTFDADNLHQVRVGLRRLRALLQLFRPLLRKGWCRREIEHGARTHMHALDAARTLHVLHEELLPPARKAMTTRVWQDLQEQLRQLKQQEQAALAAARAYLLAPAFAYWLLHSNLALHAEPLRPKAAKRSWAADATPLLESRMVDFRKRLHKKDCAPGRLHRLRKAGKNLRYQVLAAGVAWRGHKVLSRDLEQLQGALGHFNDLRNAQKILGQLPSNNRVAIGSINAWCRAQQQQLQRDMPNLRQRIQRSLARMQPPRKEKPA